MRKWRTLGSVAGMGLMAGGWLVTAESSLAGPPLNPRVIESMAEVGRPGGEIRTLIGRARDTRLLQIYGFARLIGYDQNLQFVPDILADFEVVERIALDAVGLAAAIDRAASRPRPPSDRFSFDGAVRTASLLRERIRRAPVA